MNSVPAPPEFKKMLLIKALEWIAKNHYRIPKPSSPTIKEIHVPVDSMIAGEMAIDILVFDAQTKRLKAVILDINHVINGPIKRVDF